MMRASTLGALTIWLACAGCTTEAPAQEAKPKMEFAVFEYAKIDLAHGDRERYRWTTAKGRVEGENISRVWSALGMEGAPKPRGADRMQVLNRLHAIGWEIIAANDVSFVMAGGTAFANRYVMRRRK